jgi:hypothetical protein
MFGFFALFGRSREVQRLGFALRAAGLHPALMPDAVKLTVLKLLTEETGDKMPGEQPCAQAAELLAFCMLGPRNFTTANDPGRAGAARARLEAALEAGESLDARLVLLVLHAGVVEPNLVDRYGLHAT